MGSLAIPNLITAKLSEQMKTPVQGGHEDTWNRIRHVGKAQWGVIEASESAISLRKISLVDSVQVRLLS